MENAYYNFTLKPAASRWAEPGFWQQWRRLAGDDPRWTPPYYPALKQYLRAQPTYYPYTLEASHRRRSGVYMQPGALTPTGSSLLADLIGAAILFPRANRPNAAHFALFQCANDVDVLVRFFELLAEDAGFQQFYGPAGLSPYLPAGVLGNHWHDNPPLHTPYSPPFLSDIMDKVMKPAGTSQLYWVNVPAGPSPETIDSPARLVPLRPADLGADLFPLFQAAFQESLAGVPGREEAHFLLAYLAHFPTFGWLAMVEEKPAGFVFLQPDYAPLLRQAGGGRFPWWRAWLRRALNRPAANGRLLYGAVLPVYRGQGIGRHLWQATLRTGRELGWLEISIGPVGDNQPGAGFLMRQGAEPRQRYTTYSWEASAAGGIWW